VNILVTGGAGYIGSHTCKALAAAGFLPIAYDNIVSGHEWAVRWGPLVRGDILDRQRLKEAFQQYKPTAVMHFAAYTDVGESVEQPLKYYRNNVAGTLSLLETMREHGVSQMVFSSTCATYGIPKTLLISEAHPQNPINPYGASKLVDEQMLEDVGRAHGICSVSLRYFNAAGADPDGDIGEERTSEGHLIPLVLQVAAGQRSHVTVFGTDYETPDGTCVRDYVHVSDLAEAHVLALNLLKEGSGNKSFNLGTGRGFSVREVIQTARLVTGRTITVAEGPRRPGDPSWLVADATRAKNELGWKPKYDDLNRIIHTAWHWLCKRRSAVAAPHLHNTNVSQVDAGEPHS
jgi:UDP-arabinose 4-epimerase